MSVMTVEPAEEDDFSYVYGLCETTMRGYVETDFGDCFEEIACPTIKKLISLGLFFKVYLDGALVGAFAYERHDTHIQFEELYVKPSRQQQGIGKLVMARVIEESSSIALPIKLHVLASNTAKTFYEKLGFAITRSTGQVNYMERKHYSGAAPVA